MTAERKIRILAAEVDSSFLKMLENSLEEAGSCYHFEKVGTQ